MDYLKSMIKDKGWVCQIPKIVWIIIMHFFGVYISLWWTFFVITSTQLHICNRDQGLLERGGLWKFITEFDKANGHRRQNRGLIDMLLSKARIFCKLTKVLTRFHHLGSFHMPIFYPNSMLSILSTYNLCLKHELGLLIEVIIK